MYPRIFLNQQDKCQSKTSNRHNNNRRHGNNNNRSNQREEIEQTNALITYFKSDKNAKEVTIKVLKVDGEETKKYIPLYDNHYPK